MSKADFQKIHIRTPVSILVHGANQLGFDIAQALAKQGSKVIIIDDYTAQGKDLIAKLKKNSKIDFIDFHGIEEFYKTIDRVDYMFFIQYDYLLSQDVLNSRDFLHESNNLNLSLKLSLKNKAKFNLITSIELNKKLAREQFNNSYMTPSPYSTSELQKYSETLTAEYHDKSNANVRIIRLGTVLGENYAIHDEDLDSIFENAVKSNVIKIFGEGLETHHLLSAEDAIYGILKLAFDNKTKGEVISLANNNEYTTLSVAYKVLELNPNASEIKFEPHSSDSPVMHNLYIPAPNASEYGWEQKSPLQETITEMLELTYERHNKQWYKKPGENKSSASPSDSKPEQNTKSKAQVSDVEETQSKTVRETSNKKTKTIQTGLGKSVSNFFAPLKSAKVKEKLNAISLLKLAGITVVLTAIYYFLLGPVLTLIITGILTYRESKSLYSDLQTMETERIPSKIERIHKYSNSQITNLERLNWLFLILGQRELYENTSNLFYSINYIATGTEEATETLVPVIDYLREFQPSVTPDDVTVVSTRQYREELQAIADNKQSLDKAAYDIILGAKLAREIDVTAFPKFLQDEIILMKDLALQSETYIPPAKETLSLMPELLGLYERKKYIVLLQNPSEIRSTGGWISSFAIIQVEGGQIVQFTVNDVYDLDGKLAQNNKFYPAPDDMESALDVENWNLSLSNWSPDFPTAASSAEFFIEQAGDIYQADGVIAVNLNLIQDLLNIWGGLELSDSTGAKTLVNSENLYDMIFEIHKEYTPGSTQKSEFLRQLTDEVIKKVVNFSPKEIPLIAETLLNSLDEKDLLIHMDSDQASGYLITEGWNGALKKDYQSAPAAVDWNWGANKANLFTTRASAIDVDIISPNEIRYSYKVNLSNSSVANVYPEGDYTNYFRIFLPETANVTYVDGFEENSYTTTYSNGFKVIGGWFNTPIKSSNSLEISYTLKRPDSSGYFPISIKDDKIVYDLDIYKQPGIEDSILNLEINYPNSWAITESDSLSSSNSGLIYQSEFDTDKQFTLIWLYK
ncbi:DUF4012 domain-containing protein [Candidatus Dojkabacteria bacterium]|nr:DUF4012 domain-containing protein [Candidatus Dojkabacteria bacterium]